MSGVWDWTLLGPEGIEKIEALHRRRRSLDPEARNFVEAIMGAVRSHGDKTMLNPHGRAFLDRLPSGDISPPVSGRRSLSR